MSDPLEVLKDAEKLSTGPTLPAAEVRRRGDRMRRRRTAAQTLAAVCAVAVVVTGGAALGGDLTGATPEPGPATQQPSPRPTPDADTTAAQATRVPRGFPLTAGLPEPDADTTVTRRSGLAEGHAFDPCHNAQAAGDVGLTDARQVTLSGPASTHVRELAVYENSTAANAAMLLLKRERERCPVYMYDDGVSQEFWEDSPASPGDVPAEDRVLAVNRSLNQGIGFMTPATHWTVARIGNAVLSLGYEGEFGAEPGAIARAAQKEVTAYQDIARAMCPFADEGTATDQIGCDEPGTAPAAGPVTDPGPDFLLDEGTLRSATGVSTFEVVPDAQMATLACQGDWLSSFDPDSADYRQFESRADDGSLAAWAGTAVLGFADAEAARTAYETVTGDWLRECGSQVDPSHRLVTVAGSGLGEPHSGDAGPGRYFWRGVKLTAPETCVECDAAWDDHEGAVLLGSRLVLAHVAYGGDMQLPADDSRSPMSELLTALADRIRQEPGSAGGRGGEPATALGPDGYGDLALGMTAAEAEETGLVTLEDSHGEGCTSFGIVSSERKGPVGTGSISAAEGVSEIFAGERLQTPEGIGLGATKAEVRATYPDLTEADDAWPLAVGLVTPAAGGSRYGFGFEQDRLTVLMLASRDNPCSG